MYINIDSAIVELERQLLTVLDGLLKGKNGDYIITCFLP